MIYKIIFCLVATLTLSINNVYCSSIYRPFPGDELQDYLQDDYIVSEDDNSEEPVYQPRFLPLFGDNNAIGKVVDALQNPGNKTLQENLFNAVADVVLKNFGGDETVKKVIEVVKNSQNKTFQEIVMNVAAEVAISKLGGDETIVEIAEILKNPGNKTLQENLIKIAAKVADNKLKSDGTLQKVVEVLQKPGNRTLQENLLNVVFELGTSKFGDDEIIKSVAEVFKKSGNKTLQENLLNLATSVALTKFGNNPIIKLVATSIQNSGANTTLNEKVGAVIDAALTAGLGPVQAALIKQGLGVAGQALKVGGGLLGDALADIGGDSPLGKAGQAISNGTQMFGGLLSDFGGGDKGVGAAIEKFGESLKNKNVTVQQALKQAGGLVNMAGSGVEEAVSAILENDDPSNEISNTYDVKDTENSVGSTKNIEEDSNSNQEGIETPSGEEITETRGAYLTATDDLAIDKAESSSISDITKETESNSKLHQEDVDILADEKEIESQGAETKNKVVEAYVSEVNSNDLVAGDDKKTTERNDIDNQRSSNEQIKFVEKVSNQLITEIPEEPLTSSDENKKSTNNLAVSLPLIGVTQFNEIPDSLSQQSNSKQQTIENQATLSKIGKIDQNTQISLGQTAGFSNQNTNIQNAFNEGVESSSNSNYGIAQNSLIQSKMATDSSRGNVYSQTGANIYGESYENSQVNANTDRGVSVGNSYSQGSISKNVDSASSGPLKSAIDAIEAAREALQAGGEALGGAVGSLSGGGRSGNSGLGRSETPAMNIEITQIKLKMA